jgi:uncharacterized protein
MSRSPSAARAPRDRRFARALRSIDYLLDRAFRPWGWAAAASRYLGLQGRVRVSTSTITIQASGVRDHADPPPFSPPLRIGFASDFHAGPTTHPSVFEEACGLLRTLRPDVLLLGGDYVSLDAANIGTLTRQLSSIGAPGGKFAVMGNHDLGRSETDIVRALEEIGVTVLRNACARLPSPYDDVWICGLDDPIDGDPRADLAMDAADGIRVVVMHAPDGLLAIGDRDFTVAFSGHTHGGQLSWPSGKPIVVPAGLLSRRYASGRFQLPGDPAKGRRLIVSRGVGCSALPIRLFSPPEVHLCTLATRSTRSRDDARAAR